MFNLLNYLIYVVIYGIVSNLFQFKQLVDVELKFKFRMLYIFKMFYLLVFYQVFIICYIFELYDILVNKVKFKKILFLIYVLVERDKE